MVRYQLKNLSQIYIECCFLMNRVTKSRGQKNIESMICMTPISSGSEYR